MAGLEFDGLLSSHSVFVSPVDRYGQQHTVDRYTHSKVIGADEVGGGDHDVEEDPHWRWAGPADTGGEGGRVGDSVAADPESELAHHEHHQEGHQERHPHPPGGEQDHFTASAPAERLPADDNDGESWEDGSVVEVDHFDDAVDGSWVRRPSVDSVDDGHDHEADDGTLVQHGAPSPVVAPATPTAVPTTAAAAARPASPPLASHCFEDQPIRGLTDAKEKSLDELIAQGERQMREAQARAAVVKPSSLLSSTATTAVATPARGQGRAGPKNDEDDTTGGSSKSGRLIEQQPVRHSDSDSAEVRRPPPRGPMVSSRDGNNNSSSSVRSPRGGGGLRVSLRSGASFATSWSGGDLSMGVTPAVAAGAGGQGEEDESMEERERREFYELEMELLREEERGEGAASEAAAAGAGAGAAGHGGVDHHRQGGSTAVVVGREEQQEHHRDEYWDNERQGLAEGLEFESAANSKSRHLGFGGEAVASDSVHLAAAGRYGSLPEDVGVEGGSAGNTGGYSTRASHPQAMSPGGRGLQAPAPLRNAVVHSDAEEEEEVLAWEDNVQVIPGGGLCDDIQRQGHGLRGGERMLRNEDDDDTRRWEEVEEGNHDDGWPSQERDEWGQTAMRRSGDTQGASQHAGQQHNDAFAMGSRRTVSGPGSGKAANASPHRLQHNRLTHTPPPVAPARGDDAETHENGGGGSNLSANERERVSEQHSDTFEDDQAWGDVDNATAGVERAATAGGAPGRHVNAGQQQGFPNGGRAVGVAADVGAPWPSQARPEESARPPSAGTPQPPPQGVPSQSKLVQRVFGARGRRGGGRGRGGRGRLQPSSRSGRGSRAGEGVHQEEGGQGGGSWAVQAELQGKLQELEEEVSRFKEENERARLARRKQESALAEVMRKRQEVREWAEAEKAAVEAWCTEQRQASAREKRTALKQLQGLRARAQAGGGLGGGTAAERRQRQEIEGLKATIERAKLDAETAKKKARASERRLQQQIKAGAERVAELEGQVSFLERQRVEALASSKGAGVLGGVGGASKASTTPGLSRSMNGGTTSVRKSANSIARARGALGVSATDGSSSTARVGGGRSTAAAGVGFVSVESASAGRSRWPVERNQEQEHERHEQEVFPEERPLAARESWERRQEEEEEGANMRFHHGVSEGGEASAARGVWRQGGGQRIRKNASSTPVNVNGSADHDGAHQYEGDPGRQPRHAHRWAGEEGLDDGGQDARWEEEAGAEGGRRLDSQNPGRPSDGGLPWRAEHGGAAAGRDPNGSSGRSASSRVHDGADQPLSDGFRRTHGVDGERNEPRFGGDGSGRDRGRDEQQPGRQRELHYGAAAPAFSHGAGVEIRGRQDGEALARDDASFYRDSNGSDGNPQPLDSSWGVRRSSASSPDGVKYDPMRYEKAVVSQGAAGAGAGAAEGGEHGAWAGAHPDPPRGERAGGGGRGEGMRSINSDGRQSMRASASAAVATLDRTSPLRHSDAAGMGGGRWAHPRFRQALQEGPAAADDAERRQATAGDSGGDGVGARPQDWERLNGTREEGRKVGHPAFTGGRSRHERAHQQVAMAMTQSVDGADEDVSRSAERDRAHVVGGAGKPDTATTADGLNASAGAGRGLPAGGGASGSGSGSGGKVEHVLRDGRRVILFANGTQKETLPDGGCVVRFVNGDLKRVEGGTGVVVYTYAAARTTHTMHPSGLEVFEFPNGQVERHHKTGEKEIDFPDGTRKYILPSGREMSEFPDGVTVVEYPEGHRDVTSPDGTTHRERPDGTVQAEPAGPGGSPVVSAAEVGSMGVSGRGGVHPKLVAAMGTSRAAGW